MRIGIDIDDTLALSSEYLMPFLFDFDKKEASGNGIIRNHRKYQEAFDWSIEEHKLFRDKYADAIGLDIPVKKDAAKYVRMLKELGHSIIIITARRNNYYNNPYEVSKEWLEKNNIMFDKLLAFSSKKGEVCRGEKIDLLIDDSFGQASYVATNLKIPVLMPVDSYNIDKECDGILKVNSWEEIYNIVSNMK